MYKVEQIISAIYSTIPYSDQIEDLEIQKECVRFKWRGDSFRVSTGVLVEQVDGGCLVGSNIALIIENMIRRFLS